MLVYWLVFNPPIAPLLNPCRQVDASKMEAFTDHFVRSLGLDSTYSLVVVNPTWTPLVRGRF
jgi:hypothetical protein